MENYDVLGLVGEGSFGRVYKAKYHRTDEIVAIKIIRKVRTIGTVTLKLFVLSTIRHEHNLNMQVNAELKLLIM
jgi:fused-like protein